MILRPRARPQSLVRAFVRSNNKNTTFGFQQRRSEHTVPQLGANDSKGLFFQENGVPGFLTARTFKQTWTAYQQHLCDEVNSSLVGTKNAIQRPLELHETLAHNPEDASTYNAAAMLHFNHLFWESISPEKKPIPSALKAAIETDFGSVEDLRVEMLQHADAMFGNGFVWLLKEASKMGSNKPSLRILCTYNAGSPYQGAHERRQTQDMATTDTNQYANRMIAGTGSPQNRAGVGAVVDKQWPLSMRSHPVLCLNNWQHMYMLDYGILGKQTYLSAWWERIDWDVAFDRFNMDSAMLKPRGSPLHAFR